MEELISPTFKHLLNNMFQWVYRSDAGYFCVLELFILFNLII